MIRGTTPQHTYMIPFGTEHISKVRVVYSQYGQVVLTKEVDTFQDECSFTVCLTQEETLRFDASCLVDIQLRVLMDDGQALCSDIIKCGVGRCLESGVIA